MGEDILSMLLLLQWTKPVVDSKKKRSRSKPKIDKGECVIPPALPAEALCEFVLNAGGKESDRVSSYVEWQAPDETVLRLEKVASESIFGQPMEGWDVQTDKGRRTCIRKSCFRVWITRSPSMSAFTHA